MNDFCRACGEIEAQAQAMMEPGEPGAGKTAQDAADALMQEAEAIMKAEFSPAEQSGPVIALASGNSKPSKAVETGRAAASVPNGTSAIALGAAASKAAPLPKKVAQPPLSKPQPAPVAVVQAQVEEVIEEEEEEEEEVVEDGTVDPETVPLAVPTNTHAAVTMSTVQVAQEATAAVDQEEVIEEEEEEEEENAEDETVEPGEAAAGATEPEEVHDSQLMAQLSQTAKRKARVVEVSTAGKRLRAAT